MRWIKSDRTPSLIDRFSDYVSVKHFRIDILKTLKSNNADWHLLGEDNEASVEALVIRESGVKSAGNRWNKGADGAMKSDITTGKRANGLRGTRQQRRSPGASPGTGIEGDVYVTEKLSQSAAEPQLLLLELDVALLPHAVFRTMSGIFLQIPKAMQAAHITC